MSMRTRHRDLTIGASFGVVVALLVLLLGGLPLGLFGPAGPATASPSAPPVVALGDHPGPQYQNVSVTSAGNFSSPLNLSPLFYGVNVEANAPFTASDAQTLNDTSALTWRFPGGNLAEEYDYETGKNASSNVTLPTNVSKFIELCESVRCRAILQLPAEINNSSVDAGDVNYVVNTLHFHPAVWEFGNEPALWSNFSRPWPWTTPGALHATPSSYSAMVPSIITAIRSVDPTTPIAPLDGIGGGSSADAAWITAVMSAVSAANLTVQYISIHSYLLGDSTVSNNSTASFYRPLYTYSYTLSNLIPAVYADIAAGCPSCRGVGVLISEDGVSTHRTNVAYETGFPMAMWDAVQSIQAARADASSIDFFAYRSGNPSSFEVGLGRLDPSYFLFKDITPFLGSTALNLTLSQNDAGMLQVGGWWGAGNVSSLLAVNLDQNDSINLTVAGSGFPVTGNIETYVWNDTLPEPVGAVTTSLGTLTLAPNSMELVSVYPSSAATTPPAPTGPVVAGVNLREVEITYAQPTGPIVNDSISFGAPTSSPPYCAPVGTLSLGRAVAGGWVTNLTPGTSYCFAARAWTVAGPGPLSNFVNATTAFIPRPELVVTALGAQFINVSWTNPTLTAPFRIINDTLLLGYVTAAGCAYVAPVSLGLTSSDNLTGLQPGLAYCVELEAWDNASHLREVVSLNVTTLAPGAVPTPALLAADVIEAGNLSVYPTGNVDVSAGDLVLVGVGTRSSTTVPRVTDSAGNTFTVLRKGNVTATGAPGDSLYVFSTVATHGGSPDSITCLPGGFVPGACEVLVFGNVSPTLPIDTTGVGISGGNLTNGSAPYDFLSTSSPNDTAVLFASQASSTPGGLTFSSTTNSTLVNWTSESSAASVYETVGDGVGHFSTLVDGANLSFGSNASGGNTWVAFSVAVRGAPTLPAPSGLSAVARGPTSLTFAWSNPPVALANDSLFFSSGGNFTRDVLAGAPTAATLTGLAPNTTYDVYVQSATASGSIDNSLVVVDRTMPPPPGTPTGLTVVGVTVSSVALTWAPSSGPNLNSTVYVANASAGTCGSFGIADSVGANGSSYTVTGLGAAQEYCFEVAQWNASGESTPTAPTNATTLPEAPTGVRAAAASSTSITVSWTAPSGAITGFYVNWSLGTTCTSTSSVLTGALVSSSTVGNLTTGTTYCFYVRAVDVSGFSAPSSIVTNVTDQVPGKPGSPVVGTVTTTTIALSWTNPSGGGLLNDTVYWGSGGCSALSPISTGSVVTSWTVTSLSAATAYCFAVQVWNATGGSPWSGTANGTTLPEAPSGLLASAVSNRSITINWTNPSGAVSDDFVFWERGSTCTDPNRVDLHAVSSSYTRAGLAPAALYCFFVQAVSAGGASANSSFLNDTTLPDAPSGVTVTHVTNTTANLSWTNPSGAVAGDTVFAGPACGTWTVIDVTSAATTSFTVESLLSATEYCFAVEARSSGGAGALSPTTTGTTVPDSVTGFSHTDVTLTTVTVQWTNPSGTLTDDLVFWASGATCGSPTEVDLHAVESSFTASGLATGATYCFYVEAESAGGPSVPSSVVTAVTESLPAAPTNLTVESVGTESVALQWTNPSPNGLLNDTVEFGSTCGSWSQTLTTGGVAGSVTVTGLSSATTYCFAVEAWNGAGVSPPSSPTLATTLPTAPTGLVALSSTQTTVTLNWTAPPGVIVDYFVFWATGGNCTAATDIDTGSTAARFVVTGLVTNTLYCFYVEAASASGAGSPSAPALVVTASLPGSPTSLDVFGVTDTSAVLAWQNPATPGVLNDTVFYGPSCGHWTAHYSTDGAVSTFRFSTLAAGSTYCFAVQAWNETGGGLPAFLNGTTAGGHAPSGFLGLSGSAGTLLVVELTVAVGALAVGSALYFWRRPRKPPVPPEP
jgi:hypothetical protein